MGALGGGLFLFLAGGEQRLEQLIPNALASLRPLVWVIGIVLLGIVIYLTQSWAHGRFHLEKLTAGPATITLTEKSAYYFDEFLDDIVFYFQRTGKNVVIFEDLDRFDNAHRFDTLRELNTILNNASQLDARPIRFVYAIKDSMFEQLGVEKKQVKATEPATNRTKFFELVVPIVPFISHRTARDLIEPEMEGAAPELGGAVVQVVARHVTSPRTTNTTAAGPPPSRPQTGHGPRRRPTPCPPLQPMRLSMNSTRCPRPVCRLIHSPNCDINAETGHIDRRRWR